MSDAEHIAVMQRWFDAVNAHDADRLADLLDEGFLWEGSRTSGLGRQATTAASSTSGWLCSAPSTSKGET